MQDRRRYNANAVVLCLDKITKPARAQDIHRKLDDMGISMSRGATHAILQTLIESSYVLRKKMRVRGAHKFYWVYHYMLTPKGHHSTFVGGVQDLLSDAVILRNMEAIPAEEVAVSPRRLQFFLITQDRGPSTSQWRQRVKLHNEYDNNT